MKKLLILIIGCMLLFMLVGMGATTGVDTETDTDTDAAIITDTNLTLPDPEEAWIGYMEYRMKVNQSDPEVQAYCTKWLEIGFDALNPWPDEWQYPDGSFKDFVTIEMIVDVYEGSLLQEYDISDPEYAGRTVTVGGFCFSDGSGSEGSGPQGKNLCYAISYLE